MSNIVVISGHPALSRSYTNRVILDEIAQKLEGVAIRKLDLLYPDHQIDIKAEQQALLAASVIVLQFPFYWYALPALLKSWLDQVFSFNFAFGPQGDKLKNKKLILSFTVGGPQESYAASGYNHFSIAELMRPMEQTAALSGLVLQPLIYTHGMVYIPGVYNTQEEVEARARHHAQRLLAAIQDVTTVAAPPMREPA